MNAIARISLCFAEGSSDKEYHAEIIEVTGGNVVNFRYGRRGGVLTAGTKTSSPVDFTEAKKIYDKLIKEKTAKGYTPDQSGVSYQGMEQAGNKSDFLPQLLNPITEREVLHMISDNDWTAQQKMDGERRAAHAENGSVIGMNRKGLVVPLPQSIEDELQAIAVQSGAIRVDGELIGDVLHVFDLHVFQGRSLHATPWLKRMRLAQIALVSCDHLQALSVAVSISDKLRLWGEVSDAHGEGVVFKHRESLVSAGRPNSGGEWLKYKFTQTASCCVMGINTGKSSVKLGMLDEGHIGQMMVPMGNVTIPSNHEIPQVGEIVEVQYLYAYKGGSLYQPVYRGKRHDIDVSACTVAQLKYKPESNDEEGA